MKKNVIDKENRNFGLMIGACFIFIFIYQWVVNQASWFLLPVIGGILILMAFVKPVFLNKLRTAWIQVGSLLGVINTYLILSIVFLFIITPVGWLLRLFRKTGLFHGRKMQQDSYWIGGDEFASGSFEQQF